MNVFNVSFIFLGKFKISYSMTNLNKINKKKILENSVFIICLIYYSTFHIYNYLMNNRVDFDTQHLIPIK